MSTTITVRTDPSLREALQRQADEVGKSLSSFVRDVLQDAVARRTIGEKAGHLKGRLALPRRNRDPWREELRRRNWRE